ncbi:MAG: c-type cytochrome [Candidatus Rokuibacteriota bacterium]
MRKVMLLSLLAGLAALVPGPLARPGLAQKAEFTAQFLQDPKTIEAGRAIWKARCQFCHGKAAYPGKAPKLDPSRYTPAFVYERVTNGFKAMPGWRTEFTDEELRAVTAYVLSREFSN